MSNYIPGYQKRNRIFAKRVRELAHAVKHEAGSDKLIDAVECVRAAKLYAIQAQNHAPPSKQTGNLNSQAERWRTMTVEEIIAKCVRPSSSNARSAETRDA